MVWRTLAAMAWFSGIFFVAIPWAILHRTGERPATGPLAWLAWVGLVGVLAALAAEIAVFVRRGRGTPVPLDPPRELVTAGAHRWLRNPMYALYVVVIVAEAAVFASPALLAYAAAFFLLVHAYVVGVEEPGLRRRFGARYADYCAGVPRWIPRRPRG